MTVQDVVESYSDVLEMCPLFEGFSGEELTGALMFYGAVFQSYLKGETLLKIGSCVSRFALVLSGTVHVLSDDINGSHMIMATVQSGQCFGESLCYRQAVESPVYALAETQVSVLWLKADGFSSGECVHCHRFISMLTRKTLMMNSRIQVLSKLTLREKLMTLFSQYAEKPGKAFALPFDREALAVYLGANRSALSRELSKMHNEGLIEYEKNSFIVLPKK